MSEQGNERQNQKLPDDQVVLHETTEAYKDKSAEELARLKADLELKSKRGSSERIRTEAAKQLVLLNEAVREQGGPIVNNETPEEQRHRRYKELPSGSPYEKTDRVDSPEQWKANMENPMYANKLAQYVKDYSILYTDALRDPDVLASLLPLGTFRETIVKDLENDVAGVRNRIQKEVIDPVTESMNTLNYQPSKGPIATLKEFLGDQFEDIKNGDWVKGLIGIGAGAAVIYGLSSLWKKEGWWGKAGAIGLVGAAIGVGYFGDDIDNMLKDADEDLSDAQKEMTKDLEDGDKLEVVKILGGKIDLIKRTDFHYPDQLLSYSDFERQVANRPNTGEVDPTAIGLSSTVDGHQLAYFIHKLVHDSKMSFEDFKKTFKGKTIGFAVATIYRNGNETLDTSIQEGALKAAFEGLGYQVNVPQGEKMRAFGYEMAWEKTTASDGAITYRIKDGPGAGKVIKSPLATNKQANDATIGGILTAAKNSATTEARGKAMPSNQALEWNKDKNRWETEVTIAGSSHKVEYRPGDVNAFKLLDTDNPPAPNWTEAIKVLESKEVLGKLGKALIEKIGMSTLSESDNRWLAEAAKSGSIDSASSTITVHGTKFKYSSPSAGTYQIDSVDGKYTKEFAKAYSEAIMSSETVKKWFKDYQEVLEKTEENHNWMQWEFGIDENFAEVTSKSKQKEMAYILEQYLLNIGNPNFPTGTANGIDAFKQYDDKVLKYYERNIKETVRRIYQPTNGMDKDTFVQRNNEVMNLGPRRSAKFRAEATKFEKELEELDKFFGWEKGSDIVPYDGVNRWTWNAVMLKTYEAWQYRAGSMAMVSDFKDVHKDWMNHVKENLIHKVKKLHEANDIFDVMKVPDPTSDEWMDYKEPGTFEEFKRVHVPRTAPPSTPRQTPSQVTMPAAGAEKPTDLLGRGSFGPNDPRRDHEVISVRQDPNGYKGYEYNESVIRRHVHKAVNYWRGQPPYNSNPLAYIAMVEKANEYLLRPSGSRTSEVENLALQIDSNSIAITDIDAFQTKLENDLKAAGTAAVSNTVPADLAGIQGGTGKVPNLSIRPRQMPLSSHDFAPIALGGKSAEYKKTMMIWRLEANIEQKVESDPANYDMLKVQKLRARHLKKIPELITKYENVYQTAHDRATGTPNEKKNAGFAAVNAERRAYTQLLSNQLEACKR